MKKDADTNFRALPTQEEIAQRANQICQERGSQAGHEIDDWLQAEYDLMQLPVGKIAELEPTQVTRGRLRNSAIVSLVQLAMFLGASGITQFRK